MDTTNDVDTSSSWGLGGARQYDVDTRDEKTDTLIVDQSTAIKTRFIIGLEPDTLGGRMLDTTLNHGWASRVVAYSAERDDPVGDPSDYGEHVFYHAGETNFISVIHYAWPSIWVDLDTWSTSVPEPTIATDADSIVFTGILGQTIAPQYLQVTNSAGGALECASITDDGAWLSPIVESANTPLTVTLAVTAQAVGYTSATLTIVCADASNTPKTVKIVRNLTAATARQAKGAIEIR